MKVKILLLSIVVILSIISSQGVSQDIYDGMKTENMHEGGLTTNYYFFSRNKKNNSKTLFVFLEGSGKSSVLGKKHNDQWQFASLTYLLNQYLDTTIDILVPERINLDSGHEYKNIQNYSVDNAENKIALYSKLIDQFINQNPNYKSVFIMGYSEGGIILPKIVLNLQNKHKVSGIILVASGGLSFYENLKIQQQSTLLFTKPYRESLNNMDQSVKSILKNPLSRELTYFGWPYLKWSQILMYKPVTDIKKLKMPILILHGDADKNIPIESSRALVDAIYTQKKYTYIEYRNADHYFNGDFQKVIQDISAWIFTNP